MKRIGGILAEPLVDVSRRGAHGAGDDADCGRLPFLLQRGGQGLPLRQTDLHSALHVLDAGGRQGRSAPTIASFFLFVNSCLWFSVERPTRVDGILQTQR